MGIGKVPDKDEGTATAGMDAFVPDRDGHTRYDMYYGRFSFRDLFAAVSKKIEAIVHIGQRIHLLPR